MTNRPSEGPPQNAWSPLFTSQLVFFIALGFSSAGSLAWYMPGALPKKMLLGGIFFGLSLAGLAYVALNLRNRQGPLSRREWMILAPVICLVVAMLVTRAMLLFHGG